MTYSVIVPVYNRPDEVQALLESLAAQTFTDFEVIIVEDGSTIPCREQCEAYPLMVRYFFKPNEGRSIARNYGMERASGDYFIFFDSDCVIPSDYFARLDAHLQSDPLDCFGGPDSAHESFSTVQKAINFAMTSFLTTGGIRGGKVQLEKFTPRTFNMGFRRSVWHRVGGFREMFSEDIDMSMRIRREGYSMGLVREAAVYHRRRVDFCKFARQVHVFGRSRITLQQLYPGSLKPVHTLPALFTAGCVVLLLFGAFLSPWWLALLALYMLMLLLSALVSTRSIAVSLLAVPASLIQLWGYGSGFIRAAFSTYVLRRGRDVNREIEIRKGSNERL